MFDLIPIQIVDGSQEVLALPAADDVRPCHCPRCGALARRDGRVRLEGNGVRWRPVLVPSGGGEFSLLQSWVRRYRCLECGASPSVQPEGVIPGHLYSLAAMLVAWFGITAEPVGDGKTEREVCAHQGVDRPRTRRWRSPRRWTRQIDSWWPSGVFVTGAEGLLVQLLAEAGGRDFTRLTQRAVAGHALWGAAM